ncbi:MAG: GNAT family N-acetyltransferase [Butyrivibrio sp.]|nr:GNAT family N-acetyltransferase [Butyrivibrio sp.]
MLNSIIFLLKKYEEPDADALLPAVLLEGLPESPEGALVVTDDERTMREAEESGFAVVFCSNGEKYVDGADYVVESAAALDYGYANTAYCRMKGLPLTVLETPRTVVRETCADDLPELYAIYDDDAAREFTEPLMEYEREKSFIESYIHNMYGFCGFGLWSVTERESGKLIGRAGISIREIDGENRTELGYLIAREYRRRGYAFEVCRAIKEYAFERLGTETLYIVTRADNTASVKTAEKLGFGKPSLSVTDGCEYMIFQCKE